MRTLAAIFALFLPTSVAAQGATKTYPPQFHTSAGVEIALLAGTWADDGIGLQGHFDTVLAPKVGPGHTTGGAYVLLAMADDDDDDGPCEREETIVGLGGRLKYVADIHPVIRPWGGVGMGVYSIDRDDDPCTNRGEDDDIGVGVPLSVGLDFTLQSLTVGVSINAHGTTADDDFSHLGLGASWRF